MKKTKWTRVKMYKIRHTQVYVAQKSPHVGPLAQCRLKNTTHVVDLPQPQIDILRHFNMLWRGTHIASKPSV